MQLVTGQGSGVYGCSSYVGCSSLRSYGNLDGDTEVSGRAAQDLLV